MTINKSYLIDEQKKNKQKNFILQHRYIIFEIFRVFRSILHLVHGNDPNDLVAANKLTHLKNFTPSS